jgi:hypothetical protein
MVLVNLIVALVIHKDFGLTWDEPLFYQYGDAVGYAYSISAHLSPDFDLEKAYGPSGSDHKIYGPAYLLIGQILRKILGLFLSEEWWSLWRLVNFIFFQSSLVTVFVFSRRWLEPWAALFTTAIMAYQPLLWGMAFINPKDMPFLVFFVFSLAAGMKMVDRLCELGSPGYSVDKTPDVMKRRFFWHRIQIISIGVAIFCALFLIWLYSDANDSAVARLITYAYQAPPEALISKVAFKLAPGFRAVSLDANLDRSLTIFFKVQPVLGYGLGFLLIPSITLFLLSFSPKFQDKLGLFFVENMSWPNFYLPHPKNIWRTMGLWLAIISLPAIALGCLTSIRIVGPMVGIFILGFYLFRKEVRSWWPILFYGFIAVITLVITWPFLWESPVLRLAEVFLHMANNPQNVPVLFNGEVYPSSQLPVAYLPTMMALTLTEPVWPLLLAGLGLVFWRVRNKTLDWRSLIWILAWLILPVVYILWLRPPVYDGFRHFLFVLPAVFILNGFVFQAILSASRSGWINSLFFVAAVLPGIWGIFHTHPYEYAYYNHFIGGTRGAFRRFETDYWLTCYKEMGSKLSELEDGNDIKTLFVLRQPANASYYAPEKFTVARYRPGESQPESGDYLLLPTRTNNDLTYFPEAPVVLEVSQHGATFCVLKKIP